MVYDCGLRPEIKANWIELNWIERKRKSREKWMTHFFLKKRQKGKPQEISAWFSQIILTRTTDVRRTTAKFWFHELCWHSQVELTWPWHAWSQRYPCALHMYPRCTKFSSISLYDGPFPSYNPSMRKVHQMTTNDLGMCKVKTINAHTI